MRMRANNATLAVARPAGRCPAETNRDRVWNALMPVPWTWSKAATRIGTMPASQTSFYALAAYSDGAMLSPLLPVDMVCAEQSLPFLIGDPVLTGNHTFQMHARHKMHSLLLLT